MASAPASSAGAAVVDANVLIAICAKEKDKFNQAEAALAEYATKGWGFYAPGVIVGEVLYILCGKLQSGALTPADHEKAVKGFQAQMSAILPPPHGDKSLIVRAEEIRDGYGCSRPADSLYIALAEELTQLGPAQLVTFDQDLQKQIARNAPTVDVHLLLPLVTT